MRQFFQYFFSLLMIFSLLNTSETAAQNVAKTWPSQQWLLVESHQNHDYKNLPNTPIYHKYILNKKQIIIYLDKENHNTIPEGWIISPLPPAMKISENILNWDEQQSYYVQIKIAKLDKNNQQSIIQKYQIKEIEKNWLDHQIIRGNIPGHLIYSIAENEKVLWIELAAKDEAIDENVFGATNSSSSLLSPGSAGLSGQGITAGVGDNSNISHVDMQNRLISYNPAPVQNHGEHVTTTVAGAGNKDWYGRGYAPNARVISDYFSEIISKSVIYANALDLSVTNNSYGQFLGDCEFMGTYNNTSGILDELSLETPNLLHIFAAANDGNFTCTPYPKGYRTVNGAFASAKNNLVVANTNKTLTNHQTSSRGPTRDGRIKPEVAAIGVNVFAGLSDQNYGNSTGTSMASPNVAGIATLLQEHYKSLYNELPSNTLLKNILMNGATYLGGSLPNFQYGYGLVNTANSKSILDDNNYIEASVASNSVYIHTITVGSDMTDLKIMLNWMDPPGHPNADKALVHDLNLKVTGPNNDEYLPWVLNFASDHVQDLAVRAIDTLNNTEQVSILNPIPGTYTITISADDLLFDEQNFALSYISKGTYIDLHYPGKDVALDITKKLQFFWNHSHDLTGNTAIYYRVNGTGTWTLIKGNINSNTKQYSWTVPNALTNELVDFRISNDGVEDIIEEAVYFTARPVINTPAEQCWGSIRFNWNAIADVDSFAVYLLTDTEMEIIDTVSNTNTYKITQLNPYKTYWYAVAPIINGKEGIRAIAHSLKPQGNNCDNHGLSGDLTLEIAPNLPFGRKYTSQTLSQQESVPFVIRNVSSQTIQQFNIHYQINQGTWQNQNFNQSLAPNDSVILQLNNIDLSNIDEYNFVLAVENLSQNDLIPSNDTISFTIKHVDNPLVDLSNYYVEDFENWSDFRLTNSEHAFNQQDQWDFKAHQFYGRAYIDSLNLWAIEGEQSFSMDNYLYLDETEVDVDENTLTLTLNLSQEDVNLDDLRFSFDYNLHGESDYDNKVQIRGSDTDNWIDIYTLPNHEDSVGQVFSSPYFKVSEILMAEQQSYSTSFQIRFTQKDVTQISSSYFGAGVTLDNIKIYKVFNDLELVSLNMPSITTCETDININAEIKNNIQQTVYNIPVSLYNDGNLLSTEYIDSLEGQASITYDFIYNFSPSAGELYNMYAVIHHHQDSFPENDTSQFIILKIQESINQYPYFENFDNNDGGYFAHGINSSWEHGAINSIDYKNPYPNNKSWKTNLTGYHNGGEASYLYSPCFEISSLENPYMSFMANYSFKDLDLDSIVDYAKIQYSIDGENWLDIPEENQYYLHYTEENLWEGVSLNWLSYTIKIPNAAAKVQFRWFLKNGSGVAREGLAIDNVHIYDYQYPIGVFEQLSQDHQINAGSTDWGIENNQLNYIADEQNTLGLKLQSYFNNEVYTADGLSKLYPQMWVLKDIAKKDNYSIYLAMKDSLVQENIENCYSCYSTDGIYRYQLLTYSGENKEINKEIKDNKDNAEWNKKDINNFEILPYGDGYLVKIENNHQGELWFQFNEIINREQPNETLIQWEIDHYEKNGAKVKWELTEELEEIISSVQVYALKYDMDYHFLGQKNVEDHPYEWIDFPDIIDNKSYYKLRITTKDNRYFYTNPKHLDWASDLFYWRLFPNPNKDGLLNIYYTSNSKEPLTYQIISSDGKIIQQDKIELEQQTGHLKIQADYLQSGTYFMKLIQNGQKKTFPFIKL